jgi:hypothetical protein
MGWMAFLVRFRKDPQSWLDFWYGSVKALLRSVSRASKGILRQGSGVCRTLGFGEVGLAIRSPEPARWRSMGRSGFEPLKA